MEQPKAREMQLMTDKDLMARYFQDGGRLDKNEKFLRNYILNEGWKTGKGEMSGSNAQVKQDEVDREDEARDGEMEEFEEKYNFRFEHPNAATITTHARDMPAEDTLRRKETTRKEARERAKERKEDEKKRKREEINRLKLAKKEEILEKLKKAEFMSGHKGIANDPKMVEKI